jgi:hypothetical protein
MSQADACAADRAARFLARHPLIDRVLGALGRTSLARPGLSLAAWQIQRQVRATGLRQYVDEMKFEPGQDFESRFLAGLTASTGAREQVITFIEGLKDLHPRVRSGLLQTWMRAAGMTYVHREKQRIRDRMLGHMRAYPLDAMVAAFGACNLRCRGCYAAAELGTAGARPQDLNFVVSELESLNVAHVVLVGKGEPFFDQKSRDLLFGVARRHPGMFFTLYTNGTCINDDDVIRLRRCANILPLLSVDGPEALNDARRGAGVFARVTGAMERMRAAGLLFGYISTVLRDNRAAILDPAFVADMQRRGCRFGVYSMFLSFDSDLARTLMLGPTERADYARQFVALQGRSPVPLLDIDGVEAHVGCRSRAGATLYVDAVEGTVAPCIRDAASPEPGALYADRRPGRLAQILESDFFRTYRAGADGHVCGAFKQADAAAETVCSGRCPAAERPR